MLSGNSSEDPASPCCLSQLGDPVLAGDGGAACPPVPAVGPGADCERSSGLPPCWQISDWVEETEAILDRIRDCGYNVLWAYDDACSVLLEEYDIFIGIEWFERNN